ncbi:hypothetical protein ACWD69_24970 [Micromonospora chokoriensis]
MNVDEITPVRTEVRSVLATLLGSDLDPTQDESQLNEVSSRYDSLMVLDAVGAVEQAFDVAIDLVEDDLRTSFASVATIATLVTAKRADAAVLKSDF